jgi:hypothetical protein
MIKPCWIDRAIWTFSWIFSMITDRTFHSIQNSRRSSDTGHFALEAGALGVSPRIGHLHALVDEAPWHFVEASGETPLDSDSIRSRWNGPSLCASEACMLNRSKQ